MSDNFRFWWRKKRVLGQCTVWWEKTQVLPARSKEKQRRRQLQRSWCQGRNKSSGVCCPNVTQELNLQNLHNKVRVIVLLFAAKSVVCGIVLDNVVCFQNFDFTFETFVVLWNWSMWYCTWQCIFLEHKVLGMYPEFASMNLQKKNKVDCLFCLPKYAKVWLLL